ncbi:MAG: hypothetical protein KDA44_13805 [Planctomycetales bacterium]|nr:hypothetical protein [Planctomycetales bacterium]
MFSFLNKTKMTMRNSNCPLRNDAVRNGDGRSAPQRCAQRVPRCKRARYSGRSAIRLAPAAAASQRRGVLLLVVLSMLVLFLLLGTAFVVATKHDQQALKSLAVASRKEAAADSEGDLLDEVLMQLVRDTKNTSSVLRSHSLLGDFYGNDGVFAKIATGTCRWASVDGFGGTGGGSYVRGVTEGQMIEFKVDVSAPANLTNMFGYPVALATVDNAYAGQVLTFLSGRARGVSTRIVSYVPPTTDGAGNPIPAIFRAMAFTLPDGSSLATLPAPPWTTGFDGAKILINGRPFNGTGVGYDPTITTTTMPTARLSATESVAGTPYQLALMPNAAFFNPLNSPTPVSDSMGNPIAYFLPSSTLPTDMTGLGGGDESYDAPDFQNMMLAAIDLPGGNNTALKEMATNATSLDNMVLPSLHRPALLNYWRNKLSSATPPLESNAAVLRKVLLRPNWLDHPNFTGSNPEYDAALNGGVATTLLDRMIYGPWDVDNDNDGVRDSVWVDFGGPVLQGLDGKRYKPMAAILCLDMDGRANVNAAGSVDLAKVVPPPNSNPTLAGTMNASQTPRGLGMGPADYSLQPVVGNDFARLLAGDNGQPGRYGYDNTTTASNRRAGVAGYTDALAQVALYGWPGNPRTTGGVLAGAFAALPDLAAKYGLGLNQYGQPMWQSAAEWASGNTTLQAMLADSPYEIDLSDKAPRGVSLTGADSPFSMAELERALRLFDRDAATLPGRLTDLAGIDGGSGDRSDRLRITTDSVDAPVPTVALTPTLRKMMATNPPQPRAPQSVADLFEIRIRKALGAPLWPIVLDDMNDSGGALRRQIRNILRRIVAPELLAGRKLNINRPLGNGVDDDQPGNPGYGIVDEPFESNAYVWQNLQKNYSLSPSSTADAQAADGATRNSMQQFENVPFAGAIDYDPDPTKDVTRPGDPRQLLARHLYVMALQSAAPENYNPTPGSRDADLARRLAQWAVNVVDFRDPDNIMTPFEYDLNPFDGWQVNGYFDEVGPDMRRGTGDELPVGDPKSDDKQTYRGLVWGAERPELLMTETIAWHDYRTQAGGGTQTDARGLSYDENEPDQETSEKRERQDWDGSLDQVVRPRGALFIELFNPWPAEVGANADTHYVQTGNGGMPVDFGVDLTKQAIGGAPVWRVMIHQDDAFQNNALLDPDHPNASNRPQRKADRSVYFINQDPGAFVAGWDNSADGVAFFHDSAAGLVGTVRPGRYAVIGSGYKKGNGVYEANLGTDSNDRKGPVKRIVMRTSPGSTVPIEFVDETGTTPRNPGKGGQYPAFPIAAPPDVFGQLPGDRLQRQSLTDVIVIDQALDSTGNPTTRRLTVSEPAVGYPAKYGNALWVETAANEAEGHYEKGDQAGVPAAIDVPLDYAEVRQTRDKETRLGGIASGGPVIGPIENYSGAYLQRLANPMLPFDRDANPYLTIDSTAVNLTAFNGREATDPNTLSAMRSIRDFASIERGVLGSSNAVETSLWRMAPLGTRQGTVPRSQGSNLLRANPDITLGFVNKAHMDPTAQNDTTARQTPKLPYEWFSWNNRPFISGNEMLIVPALRSSQLLRQFSTAKDAGASLYEETTETERLKTSRQQAAANAPGNGPTLAFGQLENFFHDDATASADKPAGLYTMLQWIDVPSLFTGTQEWLNPQYFNAKQAGVNGLATADARAGLQAPYNTVSTMREPGKVNLNTIGTEDVYNGLFHGQPTPGATSTIHPGPFWNDFIASRRGYGNPAPQPFVLDANMPTFFANPFRGAGSGELVPLPGMLRMDVDCTLLRSKGGTAGATPKATGDPLFAATADGSMDTAAMPRDALRSPFFRYEPLVRLDNMTTTRSNVYAVWITIGFFEVEEFESTPGNGTVDFAILSRFGTNAGTLADANQDPLFRRVYPDGVKLGKEVGLDTGEVRRLRGFYMIDRTLPAAYEPGADHNVDNVVRLRRRIE